MPPSYQHKSTAGPRIVSGKRSGETYQHAKSENPPENFMPTSFIDACLAGKQCAGSLRDAGPITEAINLYAVALRTGKTLYYDAASMKITNVEDANKYLTREYRKGWDPASI